MLSAATEFLLFRNEGDSMARSIRQASLLEAFRALASVGDTIPPHHLAALDLAVRQTAGDMRLAGRSIERIVAHIQSVATEAGIRESHDRLVQDAVVWAIAYCCGEDRFEPMPSPAQYRSRSSERTVPLEVGVDSLSWVTEELDRRGAERRRRDEEPADNRGGAGPLGPSPETST
jgi:hypothetical protein